MGESNHFADFLAEQKPHLDRLIEQYTLSISRNSRIPEGLSQGIVYAAEGEGKRLRPALVFLGRECCRDWFMVDPGKKSLLDYSMEWSCRSALAVELIHTYSLVHDDLPAMDNDSLRRGRPTCHIEFDEPTAILIGDALLNQAFEVLLSDLPKDLESESVLAGRFRTMKLLAAAAGPEGMIGGQVLDMAAENKKISQEELENIHSHKTGKLIQASLALIPAFFGDEGFVSGLNRYAAHIGLLYQVVDDILDEVSTPAEMGKSGTDRVNQKTTFITLLGLDESRKYAVQLSDQAKQSLDHLKNMPVHPFNPLTPLNLSRLRDFSDYILQRIF